MSLNQVLEFFRFPEPQPNRNFVAVCPIPHNGRMPAIMEHTQDIWRKWQRDWLHLDQLPFLNRVEESDVPESFLESVRTAMWKPSRERCGLCSLRSRAVMQDRLEKSNEIIDMLEDLMTELFVSIYIEGSNADRAEAGQALLPIAKRVEMRTRSRRPKNARRACEAVAA